MTQNGLNELRELATEIDELRRKADELETRICNLYRYEEDVLDRNAHIQLSSAGAAMKDAVPCITDALIGLQKAYDAEKELMDFYEGLLNKQDNDTRRTK